jgi:translation initiation factor 1
MRHHLGDPRVTSRLTTGYPDGVSNRLPGTGRPVYETGKGRLCPECGKPVDDCRCRPSPDEPVPASLSCVLRVEKKGRGGKTVTVVAGLPQNTAFVTALAADLKRACGTGGTAAQGAVEIQGDQRDRLRPLLTARGFRVKG